MTYEDFEEGLKQRGFEGINQVGSIGKCSKDNEHFILLTDGVVIYSTIPYHRNVKYCPDEREEWWDLSDDEYSRRPFAFSDLDIIIEEVNKVKGIENHR